MPLTMRQGITGLLCCIASIQPPCLTIRAVVTTEDIDEELVSQEPLLLVPEELSMSTSLAKEQLAPILQAASLPSLEASSSMSQHCTSAISTST